ncbi:LysR family transcriptional regulator [Yoonia sp.]|uniref:LysR family transcriptional regulator n=1 Tax=Yoonia sp. TaxID=2212373 RepID=UPI0039188CD1
MRVDYLGLEAFLAIAEYGSFQRAADALNLTQAALSHRLRKIEEDLGAPLLIRSSREVSLTEIGQGLLPEARSLLTALHDAYHAVRKTAQRRNRHLGFACLPSIANSVLPIVLDQMAERHTDFAAEVHDIAAARISEVVRSGVAEFGVTIVSAELPDLRMRPIVVEDYLLFLHRNHILAGRDSVTLKDLVGLRLARISTQSRNRQLLDVAFGDMREELRWHFEVQSGPLALKLVDAGLAATILPATAISMAPPGVINVPFQDVRLQRTLGIVSRRGVPLSPQATELMDLIEAELRARFHHHITSPPAASPIPQD